MNSSFLPRPFLVLVLLVALASLVVACGGDDDDDGDNGADGPGNGDGLSSEMAAFADAAETHFAETGAFVDTGFAAFCRQGDFEFDGPFADIDYQPDDNSEYCYNVSDDLMQVALGIRESLDEPAECLVLNGASGTVVLSEVTESDSCMP